MSAVPKPRLTPVEYLAIERKAAHKSEYFNGEMFAMAGAKYEHNRINDNLTIHLGARLQGSPCFPLSSDMRVKVSPTGLYTYPDKVIVCGPPEFEDYNHDTLLNPQVVVEILSDSTERYDRGAKFRHYRQVPSLREYILIAQDQPVCERFVRQPDETWVLSTMTGLQSELVFSTVPVRIPLADLYAGVPLPEQPPR